MIQAERFALPTAVRILDIQQDNYRTKTFVLDAEVQAEPGQFVMLWLPRFDEKPFSLVNDSPVTVMISAVGPFTRLVHELQVGDRIWMRGALGKGFRAERRDMNIVIVGGGYGVAPLLWFARQQAPSAASITTIIGARSSQDVLYDGHMARLSHPKLTNLITTEDGSMGAKGRVTDALEPLLQQSVIDGIFACGPHGMLQALDELGSRFRVPCQLSWEAYMRCGVGVCGSCEHVGKVLCMDGPVLAF